MNLSMVRWSYFSNIDFWEQLCKVFSGKKFICCAPTINMSLVVYIDFPTVIYIQHITYSAKWKLTQDSPAASVCTEGDSCEISPLPSALTAATE